MNFQIKKKICFSICFLFYYTYSLENFKNCTSNDIGKYIERCENDKKRISFYLKNNCNHNSLFLYKPLYIPCNLNCPKGKYLKINPENNEDSFACVDCPENTYSNGGILTIFDLSKEFKYFCYNQKLEDDLIIKNKNCFNWSVDTEKSTLVSGISSVENVKSYSEVYFIKEFKRDGYIKFVFVKDRFMKENDILGEFQFKIDFETYFMEAGLIAEWKEVKFPISKGFHSLKLSYNVFYPMNSNIHSNFAKIEIIDLELDGTEDIVFECKNCGNSLSSSGSSRCKICPENSFFDLANNQCQTCPKFSYSYMNSIGKESCRWIVCGDYNYKAFETECKNYQKNITYDWDNPLLCNNNSMILPKTHIRSCNREGYKELVQNDPIYNYFEKCPLGQYSNNSTLDQDKYKCLTCPDGYFSPRKADYRYFLNHRNDFINECFSDNVYQCRNIEGWKFLDDRIVSGSNLPANINLSLGFNTSIIEIEGIIKFDFIITNISEEESFEFLINNITKKYDSNGQFREKFKLNKSDYNFKWVYKRNNCQKVNNSIEIKRIYVKNCDKGVSTKCIECYQNTFRKGNMTQCDKCSVFGQKPNLNKSGCSLCPYPLFSDGDGLCRNCPNFSRVKDGIK